MNVLGKRRANQKRDESMKTKTTRRAGITETQTVLFELFDPSAASVSVAGTFNDWQPHTTPMLAMSGGNWAKQLTLPPGIYEYRFVVDGRWVSDPTASQSTPNPYGNWNSVRVVPDCQEQASETAQKPDSIHLPLQKPERSSRNRARQLSSQSARP